MLKLQIFDGTTTYMFPNGEIATPEAIRKQFPAVDLFAHVLEINGHVLQAVSELDAMRSIYKIDDTLSQQEALAALEEIRNSPIPAPEPNAEERIAAALEYQNLTNMPNV